MLAHVLDICKVSPYQRHGEAQSAKELLFSVLHNKLPRVVLVVSQWSNLALRT